MPTPEVSAAPDDSPFCRILRDLAASSGDASESTMSLLAALLAGSNLSPVTPAPDVSASNPNMEHVNEVIAALSIGSQCDTVGTNHPSAVPSNEELPQPLIIEPVPDLKIQSIDSRLQSGNAESAALPTQPDITALFDSLTHHNQETLQWGQPQTQQADRAAPQIIQVEDHKMLDDEPLPSNTPRATSGPLIFESAQVSDLPQSLEEDLLAAAPVRTGEQSDTTLSSTDDDHTTAFTRREGRPSVGPVQTGDVQKESFVEVQGFERFATSLQASSITHGEKEVIKGPASGAPTIDLPEGLERRQGSASVHLEVQPPDLGRVRVHVALADQRVYATVITEQTELHDFLMKSHGRLQADLSTYGLDMGGFRVAVDSQGHGRSDPSWSFADGRDPEGRPWSDPIERALQRQGTTGLDSSEPCREDRLVNLFV